MLPGGTENGDKVYDVRRVRRFVQCAATKGEKRQRGDKRSAAGCSFHKLLAESLDNVN